MITAIIRNKNNTLVLDFPRSIYDLYEKLQSVGIMRSPKQIPLTDSEDEDIGVKLFSESDFGQHLLLTLHEKNTIADANMLTLVIGSASEDIKEELEQNILYDQYTAQSDVLENKITELRIERRAKITDSDENEMLDELKMLNDILKGVEIGIGFDAELFEQTVDSITVESSELLTFHLVGGISLSEKIREKGRCY